jgi:hypothetical protein
VEQRHDQPRGRPRALEGARGSPQAGGRRGAERDLAKGAALYKQYQQAMVDAAHHFVLIQPVYQVAVRSVSGLKLTAAGWMAELGGAKPA